jgi:MSHA biogenesis protein MshI
MAWFFSKPQAAPGWMVVSVEPDATKLAHVAFNGEGRPTVSAWSVVLPSESVSLAQLSKKLSLGGYHCATLLKPGDYQLLLVEAPNVTSDELKGAIRWKIKDLIEYHIDDATIDVLDIPTPAGKQHSMYAVSARNELLQRQIKDFEGAQIPLEVIDIPETAQRNMAQLFGDVERAVAMLSFDHAGGLLTISFAGELYLARRIEVAWSNLAVEIDAQRQHYLERVTTELQRSLDHFERQFTHLSVTQLLLAPLPRDIGIVDYLAANITIPVRSVNVAEVMDLPDAPAMGADEQWRLFHVLGAGLRQEAKAL